MEAAVQDIEDVADAASASDKSNFELSSNPEMLKSNEEARKELINSKDETMEIELENGHDTSNIRRKAFAESHKQETGKEEGKGTQEPIGEITRLEPEITKDPRLMQTFQVELEAQFEQWKEDFLKKHLTQPAESTENAKEKVK